MSYYLNLLVLMQFTLIGRVNSMKLFKWIKSLFSNDYSLKKVEKALKQYEKDKLQFKEDTQTKFCPSCLSKSAMLISVWMKDGVTEKERRLCMKCKHEVIFTIKN